MASSNLNKKSMWYLTIISKHNLSNKDRDFLVELVNEEARRTINYYHFILHDVIESKNYSKMLIEGTKISVKNLLSVIRGNLFYKITYKKLVI
ncbi:MAG: hypothetical protein QXS02_00185 [Candidatus Thermoplasmatota archaeon]